MFFWNGKKGVSAVNSDCLQQEISKYVYKIKLFLINLKLKKGASAFYSDWLLKWVLKTEEVETIYKKVAEVEPLEVKPVEAKVD